MCGDGRPLVGIELTGGSGVLGLEYRELHVGVTTRRDTPVTQPLDRPLCPDAHVVGDDLRFVDLRGVSGSP